MRFLVYLVPVSGSEIEADLNAIRRLLMGRVLDSVLNTPDRVLITGNRNFSLREFVCP